MKQQYKLATKTSRFLANAIDQFIIAILMVTIIGFPLAIVYHLYRDSFKALNYQSIGKKAVGIRILDFSKKKSPYITSIKRHWYTWVPLFAIIDGIYLIFNKKSKRFGDLIADTMVVEDFDDFVYINVDTNSFDINDKKNASIKFSNYIKIIKDVLIKVYYNPIKSKLISIYKSRLVRIISFTFLVLFLVMIYLNNKEYKEIQEIQYQEYLQREEIKDNIIFLRNNLLLFSDNIVYEHDEYQSNKYKLNSNLLISFDFDEQKWVNGKYNNFIEINFKTLNKSEEFIDCSIDIKTIDGILIKTFNEKINNLYATATKSIFFEEEIKKDFEKLIDLTIKTNSGKYVFYNLKPHFKHDLTFDTKSNCRLCNAYYTKAINY